MDSLLRLKGDQQRVKQTPTQRETYFRKLIENISEVITVVDLDGRVAYTSPSAQRVLGQEPDEYLGRSMFEQLHPDDLERAQRAFREVVADASIKPALELRVLHKDGSWLTMEAVAANLLAEPAVNGMVITWRDISKRKRAEAKFENLIENAPEAIVVVDHEGAIQLVNAQTEALFGYARDELLGKSIELLMDEGHQDTHRQHRVGYLANPRLRAMGAGIETRGRRRDGTKFPLEIGLSPLDTEGGPIVVALIRDISDRLAAEERAKVATRRWYDLTGDAIIMSDSAGKYVSWNAGAEQMFGWKMEEVVGRAWFLVPLDLMAEAQAISQKARTSGLPISYETERLTKDGRRIPVMGTIALLPAHDGPERVSVIFKDMTAHRLLEEQGKSLVRMEERERIAMDLHDGVIQALYGVSLSLTAAGVTESKEFGSSGKRIQHQIDDIIRSIRNYIFDLRPEQGDQGLEEGLRLLADEVRINSLLTVDVELDRAAVASLGPDVADDVIQIAREAVFNVIRHAEATAVQLAVHRDEDRLVLSIRDNGHGFSIMDAGWKPGDGLKNMQARASAIGCSIMLERPADGGTLVRLACPFPLNLPTSSAGARPVRVLVVDDHDVVRVGLTQILDWRSGHRSRR